MVRVRVPIDRVGNRPKLTLSDPENPALDGPRPAPAGPNGSKSALDIDRVFIYHSMSDWFVRSTPLA